MTFAFVRKFWPFGIIVALAFVVLFQRNTITGKAAKLEAAESRIKDLGETNRFNAEVIGTLSKRQFDNDAIAAAVAAKLNSNRARTIETRTVIERAMRNDPVVRAWGDTAVPVGVREALRAR